VPSQTATVLGVRRPGGRDKSRLPEILEAGENSGVALPRDVGDSEARALELACAPRAAAFEVGDDEEAVACNTLDCGLEWVRRAFDELILPATLVSFLCTKILAFGFPGVSRCANHLQLIWGRHSHRPVGGERAY
jgi:hypothetical protein